MLIIEEKIKEAPGASGKSRDRFGWFFDGIAYLLEYLHYSSFLIMRPLSCYN